jgi:hypothetical protein
MTLQTLAALYTSPVTSPRVVPDLGHILSMRGRAWAPDDTERESERHERDCEPKTRKREREREREIEIGSVKRAGAPRDRESRLE